MDLLGWSLLAAALFIASVAGIALWGGWRSLGKVFACQRIPRERVTYRFCMLGCVCGWRFFFYPPVFTIMVTRDAFYIRPPFFFPFHRKIRIGVRSVIQCERIWFGYSFKLIELPIRIRVYGAAARAMRHQLHIRNDIPPEDKVKKPLP